MPYNPAPELTSQVLTHVLQQNITHSHSSKGLLPSRAINTASHSMVLESNPWKSQGRNKETVSELRQEQHAVVVANSILLNATCPYNAHPTVWGRKGSPCPLHPPASLKVFLLSGNLDRRCNLSRCCQTQFILVFPKSTSVLEALVYWVSIISFYFAWNVSAKEKLATRWKCKNPSAVHFTHITDRSLFVRDENISEHLGCWCEGIIKP